MAHPAHDRRLINRRIFCVHNLFEQRDEIRNEKPPRREETITVKIVGTRTSCQRSFEAYRCVREIIIPKLPK